MFELIVLSLCLSSMSAHYYPNYDYGYNKFFTGLKKGGIDSYNSDGYLPQSYGYGHKVNHNYGYGHKISPNYGYGYGHRKISHSYHNPYLIVKRLPAIYKDVKQPVLIEQPVIIRKVPVFKKKKEVTVKHLPPVYDVKKPTFVEKEVGYEGGKGYKPDIQMKHHMEREIEYKPMPEMETPKHMMTDIHKESMYGRRKDMMPGVEYEDEKMIAKEKEMEGEYDLDKPMKKEMMSHMDDLPEEMMREDKMKMMKGHMINKKPMLDVEDDSVTDFDPNEFEVQN